MDAYFIFKMEALNFFIGSILGEDLAIPGNWRPEPFKGAYAEHDAQQLAKLATQWRDAWA